MLGNFSLRLISKNLRYHRTNLYVANVRIESLSLIGRDLHVQVRGWDHIIVCVMMIANVVLSWQQIDQKKVWYIYQRGICDPFCKFHTNTILVDDVLLCWQDKAGFIDAEEQLEPPLDQVQSLDQIQQRGPPWSPSSNPLACQFHQPIHTQEPRSQ